MELCNQNYGSRSISTVMTLRGSGSMKTKVCSRELQYLITQLSDGSVV